MPFLTWPQRVAPTLTILYALILLPTAAPADQLIMNNGDVISGTVKGVTDDKVTIKPSYGVAIVVDRSAVTSITTEGVFEVALADGSTLAAQLGGTRDGDQVLIVDGTPQTVAVTDVAAAALPKPYYQRSSRADLNLTLNNGNSDTQNILLYADTRLRLGAHRHLGSLTFSRDETDGVSTKEQDLFGYEYNWLFRGRWYVGATTSYERDPIRALDHRYTVGALLGRDLISDGTRLLSISLGSGYSDEEIGGISESGAVGLWKLTYQHSILDSKLAFFHNHHLNQQFYGKDNTVIKSNTGFRYDILAGIYANLAFRYDYETEPSAGSSKDDSSLVMGVGASF